MMTASSGSLNLPHPQKRRKKRGEKERKGKGGKRMCCKTASDEKSGMSAAPLFWFSANPLPEKQGKERERKEGEDG